MTSSVAIRPEADRYVYDESGFPGDVEEGNFPGVAPNNPEGTSWMIGMHRDGEDTLGKWARARKERLRKQQLALLDDSDPNLSSNPEASSLAQAGGDAGQDITATGEDNQEKFVQGVYGPLPTMTSWIVGEHRKPMWSDSETYACGTDEPCKKGIADKGHFFQSDTNPYVDKRRVFDSYAQLVDGHPRGQEAFPWDPERDPWIFHTTKPDCKGGELHEDCFRPAFKSMGLPLGPETKKPAGPGKPTGGKLGHAAKAASKGVDGSCPDCSDEPIIWDGHREVTWRNDKKDGGWKVRGHWRDGIWREGKWRQADWHDWDHDWAEWVDRALEHHHYRHYHHHHHYNH